MFRLLPKRTLRRLLRRVGLVRYVASEIEEAMEQELDRRHLDDGTTIINVGTYPVGTEAVQRALDAYERDRD